MMDKMDKTKQLLDQYNSLLSDTRRNRRQLDAIWKQIHPHDGWACVYMLISPDKKVYIGETTDNPLERWRDGHGYSREQSKIHAALHSYPFEEWEKKILQCRIPVAEVLEIEQNYIAQYNAQLDLNGPHSVHTDDPATLAQQKKWYYDKANKYGPNYDRIVNRIWLQYSDYLRIIDDDVVDFPTYYVMTCCCKYPDDLPGIFNRHVVEVLGQHSDEIAALRIQTAAYVTMLQQYDRYLPMTKANMMRYMRDNRYDIVGTIVDNLANNMQYMDWVHDLLSGMMHGVYDPYQPVVVALPGNIDPELLSAMTTVTYALPCRPVRDKAGDKTYQYMPPNPTQDLCISLLNAKFLGSGRIKVAIDIKAGIWRSVYARLDAIKKRMQRRTD